MCAPTGGGEVVRVAVDDGGSVPWRASRTAHGVGESVRHGHQPLLAQHGISQELRNHLAEAQVRLPVPPHLVGSALARRGQGPLQLLEHGLREHVPHLHVLHPYIHSHHAKSSLLVESNNL